MKVLFGIVAVVFRDSKQGKEFLILHRVLNWNGWELLKGSLDGKEKFATALKRELFEETGIKRALLIKPLPTKLEFFDPLRKCKREMPAFLVKASPVSHVDFGNNKVAEHDRFEWVNSKTALGKLSFDSQKKVFRIALKELKKGVLS